MGGIANSPVGFHLVYLSKSLTSRGLLWLLEITECTLQVDVNPAVVQLVEPLMSNPTRPIKIVCLELLGLPWLMLFLGLPWLMLCSRLLSQTLTLALCRLSG
jgi:hypothetical protein